MKLIQMDYDGEDVEDTEVQERLCAKQKKIADAFTSLVGSVLHRLDNKKQHPDAETCIVAVEERGPIESDAFNCGATICQDEKGGTFSKAEIAPEDTPRHMIRNGCKMVRSAMTPPSLSIIISFVISVIPKLKALFVPGVPGVKFPPAPDGQPPLAILINTATFIGAASVPLGLICVGSALARLQLPQNSWRSLPIASISAMATARLLIMPVLGVSICQGLTRAGVIDSGNNVLRFICMYVVFLGCILQF